MAGSGDQANGDMNRRRRNELIAVVVNVLGFAILNAANDVRGWILVPCAIVWCLAAWFVFFYLTGQDE